MPRTVAMVMERNIDFLLTAPPFSKTEIYPATAKTEIEKNKLKALSSFI
jgi:hypothetical protein